MKILSLFNHYLERGGEAQAVESINASLRGAFEVQTCEFSSADWVGSGAPPLWKQALYMFRNPSSLEQLRHQHRAFNPDVWLVHNVFPVGSAAIYREAKSLGVPLFQYVHNFRPFSVNGYLWAGNHLEAGGLSRNYWGEIRHAAWQQSRVKTAWFACVLSIMHAMRWWENVTAWIAISDFVRGKFVAAGIPEEKIFTLRHFWKPRPAAATTEGTHYLYLGRLTEPKGILVLLDAWEMLEKQSGASAPRLVIAGDGPLRSTVISRVERMRSVEYRGRLSNEDKHRALEECRAMVVPSIWWEPLGLVVYEAYDYGRPVLAAASGGLAEIVLPGETGVLHKAGNAQELAEQVLQLEQNSDGRRAMGRNGRRWLEENASEAKWQQRFREIVDRVVNA